MRVLIDTEHFWPTIGGIETFVMVLARGLSARQGVHVTVVTRSPLSVDQLGLSFQVVSDPDRSRQRHLLKSCDVAIYNSVQVRDLPELTLSRVPYLHVIHSIGDAHLKSAYTNGVADWARGYARRSVFIRKARAIIVPSEFMMDQIPFATHVIPHALDRVSCEATDQHDRGGVIAVGRMVEGKGFDSLLDAWGQVRQVRQFKGSDPSVQQLTLVGSGPLLPALSRRVASEGWGEVRLVNAIADPEELQDLMSRHLIGVVPSTVAEAFGLVALELQAAGCAVVATDAGALPEILGDSADIVPRQSPSLMASAIGRLLGSSARVAQRRAAAQRNLKRFDVDVMTDAYLRVLADVQEKPR